MLTSRILSSVIGAPILIFSIYQGGFVFLAVILVLSGVGLMEYSRLFFCGKKQGLGLPLLLPGLIIPVVCWYNKHYLVLALFAYILFSLLSFLRNYPRQTPPDLALNLLGTFYVVLGFAHFLLLRQLEAGFLLVLYVFIVVWATDTGAYFAGVYLGRHKMSPTISPNKTWEGFCGGLVSSVLAAYVFLVKAVPGSGMFLLYITPLVSVAGQMGDLFESALKRFAGQKDSGRLIPGHGGVLDRFDSAIWSVTLTYYLILYLGR